MSDAPLPRFGVHVLEASAGTGKTFAVATLHARYVIEAGLPLARVLAVTYTEAATRELRTRLRERLRLCRDALERAGEDPAALAESVDDPPGLRALRPALLAAHMREGGPALRARLRRAVEDMDLAPIFTIHGFCQRALAEHALLAGQPLAPPAAVANEKALRREVALEFWRIASRDESGAAALARVWDSPDELADALPTLLRPDHLEPMPADLDESGAYAQLRAARAALAGAHGAHGADALGILRQACARGALSKTVGKDSVLDPAWAALAAWHADPLERDPAAKKLENYGSRLLHGKHTNKGKAIDHSPVFDAIDAWADARDRAAAANRNADVRVVHAARDFAAARLPALKRERGLIGFDDMIAMTAAALDDAPAFAQALQRQYAVALVDEFQDTDPRQWAIFRRLFATPADLDDATRALLLVGDPKQAIYRFRGGDVDTYLAAREQAEGVDSLQRNFRSRPRALRAVAALFALGGTAAFAQAGIEFVDVEPGGACGDDAWQLDGHDAPGVVVQALEFADKASVETVRAQAATRAASTIARLLAAGREGRAQVCPEHGPRRPLAPRDITVLVAVHKDAERMQRALAAAGVASVAAGRASLYGTDEAGDVLAWLAAVRAPADDGRLRALLATPTFGFDAAALASLDIEATTLREWQERLQQWQAQARRHGPLAALGPALAAQAPRLLAQPGGERRLGNLLQLAEDLQLAHAGEPGLAALHAWLARRIADHDPQDEAEQLRLESDADCVRILTLHASKGLTLDLVFVPFASLPVGNGRRAAPPLALQRRAGERVGVLFPAKDDQKADQDAVHAEAVRTLYVALTRARLATWLGWGAHKEAAKSALGWLLHRAGEARPDKLEAATVAARLRDWLDAAPGDVAIETVDDGDVGAPPCAAEIAVAPIPPAAVARRALDRDWWVYSFSQLAREDAGAPTLEPDGAADDEPDAPALPGTRFSGTRFGNVLHAALERVDFAAWDDFRGELPPHGQLEPLESALRDGGFTAPGDLDEGVPLLTALVAQTLNATLPEGTRLAALPKDALGIELEFHLAFAPVAVPALLATLHAHGVLPDRRGFGVRARLEGLLTGRIDLVYVAHGRWHVLDYKSNRLPGYGPEALARAVREGEYDLQYVLYALALHRWLRFRLGAGYDPARHLGGVRYLYCRGLDRGDPAAPGVHAPTLPPALVESLDALLREVAA